MFPIAAWFSTYGQDSGRHLAAIVVDVSEEVRDRERENFRHFLDYNRLLAGAVSHEIRNLCSAASVVCSMLGRQPALQNNPDFSALAKLIDGLTNIASFELHHRANAQPVNASITAVLDQLRIIIEPDWQDADGAIRFEVEDNLPTARADAHGLLQIFLNLAQNSLRAVQESNVRELTVVAVAERDLVVVSFIDSGPGVADPARLFQAFRPHSDGTGLGLYISRKLARDYGGDLVHMARKQGCQFDVILNGLRKQSHVRAIQPREEDTPVRD